jgi:hypothetical protein
MTACHISNSHVAGGASPYGLHIVTGPKNAESLLSIVFISLMRKSWYFNIVCTSCNKITLIYHYMFLITIVSEISLYLIKFVTKFILEYFFMVFNTFFNQIKKHHSTIKKITTSEILFQHTI